MEDFYEKNAFPLHHKYGHALAQQALYPGDHKIKIFGRPIFIHHNYEIVDLCPGVEKILQKKKYAFSNHDQYGHTLAHLNPCSSVMNFKKLIEVSWLIITVYLVR